MDDTTSGNAVELATELTIAWLSNPNTRAQVDDVPAFLQKMHGAVTGLASDTSEAAAPTETPVEHTPAVSVRKSMASKEHLVSMIDGKSYKTLRRHLASHGLTPEQYRERYNLRSDYPMVAENYSASRREMAKRIGLGRKPGQRPGKPAPAPDAAPAPAKRGRKPKAEIVAS